MDGLINLLGIAAFIFIFFKFLGYLSGLKNKKIKRVLAITIGIVLLIDFGTSYYANHYYEHGEMYATEDVVCEFDGGRCGYEYKEDLRMLNIPAWVKFYRNDSSIMVMIALGLMCLALSKEGEIFKKNHSI